MTPTQLSAVLVASACVATGALAADWPSAGADLSNSRYQAKEHRISAETVGSLQLKWSLDTTGDVTANPAVDGKYLYFPDSAGFLYKVQKDTGALIWKMPISSYTGITGDYARATPAVAGKLLILGNQSGKFLGSAFGQSNPAPAQVFAVDKETGNGVWHTQVDGTQLSMVTHSAIVFGRTAFVGVASNEELVSAFVPPKYWQWQFRGSVVALDVATGQIKWKTYTVPAGYYGGSVWGSTGAVDEDSNQVFMSTGNNYAVPQAVLDCLATPAKPSDCMSADNHFDSIIALDMSSGAINWGARGLPSDIWNVACGLNVPGFVIGVSFPGVYSNCPNMNPATAGPDYDFAQGPILLRGGLVGAGQKSGMFWAFNSKTGALVWNTQAVPGGVTGGMQWGSATDGERIYVAASNSGTTALGASAGGAMPWKLKDGTTTTTGGWAALDRKTGAVVWTTKDPIGSRAEAAVSTANGVVFGCNLASEGRMVAMDAKSGAILWSFSSGGPCNAGPSIANGMVFWGTGTGRGSGPNKVFAFRVTAGGSDEEE